VFANALADIDAIDETEMQLYNTLFEDARDEWMNPRGLLFLRVKPDICLDRIRWRDRGEESSITREWLDKYQHKHDQMMDECTRPAAMLNRNAHQLSFKEKTLRQLLEWADGVHGKSRDGLIETKSVLVEMINPTQPMAETKATTPVKVIHQGRKADINISEWSFESLIGRIKDCFRDLRNRGKQILLTWSKFQGETQNLITNEIEFQSALMAMQNQSRPEIEFKVLVGQKSGRDEFLIPNKPQL
jgi:hypothetical protein